MLERAGADPTVTDSQARIAAYYIEHPNEIELPDTRDMSGSFRRFTSGKDGGYLPKAKSCFGILNTHIHTRTHARTQIATSAFLKRYAATFWIHI